MYYNIFQPQIFNVVFLFNKLIPSLHKTPTYIKLSSSYLVTNAFTDDTVLNCPVRPFSPRSSPKIDKVTTQFISTDRNSLRLQNQRFSKLFSMCLIHKEHFMIKITLGAYLPWVTILVQSNIFV